MEDFNKYSFENFILQCCKAKEKDLRKFLKKVLTNAGFIIIEDNYLSNRGREYASVHNMLAIRGNPRVCLVAHTDVCRDHGGRYFTPSPVEPVIKLAEIYGDIRYIIQDKDCRTQVGGDDRLGVAINTWIALNTGYDLGLLFTTDEEIGLVSADEVKFPQLKEFDILLQVDRGNHSNQLVTNICGLQLCSVETAQRLLDIAQEIELPRVPVSGMITDVYAIKGNRMCKEAVNMTCGYHNSIGDDPDEFIDIEEAKETVKFVASIVKDYDLEFIDLSDEEEYGSTSEEINEVFAEESSRFVQSNSDKYKNKERGRGRRGRAFSCITYKESESEDTKGYYFDDDYPGRGSSDNGKYF